MFGTTFGGDGLGLVLSGNHVTYLDAVFTIMSLTPNNPL